MTLPALLLAAVSVLPSDRMAMADRMLFSRNICTSLSMVSTRSRPSVAS